jgi:hypothetical protein
LHRKFPAHKNWQLTHHKKANEMIELGIAFWPIATSRDEVTGAVLTRIQHNLHPSHSQSGKRFAFLSRDNLDENGGGNQGLKRRPVARS